MNRSNIRRKPVRKQQSLTARKPNSVRSRRRGADYPFKLNYVIKGARP